MKAMVVRQAKGPFVEEDRRTPEPGAGEVRVRVHACGICHSDKYVKEALWPGIQLPRIPGHEVAGVVEAAGQGVTGFAPGDRVGIGWYGGHDGTCRPCREGKFIHCQNGKITGITFDGGYAEHVVAPAQALARIPDDMSFTDAAPLLCAGVTTFNALRNSGARPGDVVGILGLGGLGHLGVQYARAMGFEVVAISRGSDKEPFARELGAEHYIDTQSEDLAKRFADLGGARVILATAPSAAAISGVVPGLGLEGCLMVVGAPFEPIQVSVIELISRNARVQGWASGTAADSTDAMAFAARTGVRPMTEVFPLREVAAAYERMMSNEARFRVVLES